MKSPTNSLPGMIVGILKNFDDARGSFTKLFNDETKVNYFASKEIKEINFSRTTKKGTCRGLHYQTSPYTEVKVIYCLRGTIFDVAVDLRRDSDTFLSYYSQIISSDGKKFLMIPEGFAHGYQTLTNDCELLYLHSAKYTPDSQAVLNAKDPALKIKWPLEITFRSERDRNAKFLSQSFRGLRI